MEYTTEDLSPVKKKVTITVPVEEGEAAIATTVAMYRTTVALDGFRKGKVPASIIEKRFGESIYREATSELVNIHMSKVIEEGKFTPVSRIDYDGGEIERGKDFVYSISFDVMPEFTLPVVEGLKVEQEEALVDESEVQGVIERLLNSMAEVVDVEPARKAEKGDIAVVDFTAFDEDGTKVQGIEAQDFHLPLGDGQTLEDFENLVCTMEPGEEKEGPATFPDDFFNPEFAGKTFNMKVKLHGLKQRKLPEMTDELAKKAGNFNSIDELKESIRDSYTKSKTQMNQGEAEKKLLDSLLEKVDFPLPDSMLSGNINALLGEWRERLERQGKNLESLGKSEEELHDEVRLEAENRTRIHILLLTIAAANDLSISDSEVDLMLRRIAMQNRQEYTKIKEYYTNHNLLFALRDKMLADKAMDFVYNKAKVTMIAPKENKKNDDKKVKKDTEKKTAIKKTDEED